jgi:hypothetical protein
MARESSELLLIGALILTVIFSSLCCSSLIYCPFSAAFYVGGRSLEKCHLLLGSVLQERKGPSPHERFVRA